MSTYNGHALVLGDDDTEIPVTANLTSYRDGLHTGWRGTLAPSADSLGEVLNLTKGRLRLPGGKEADFLRPDSSDWVGTNRLTITGQDDAPF